MKIAIDGRCLAESPKTGVQEYTTNLIRETLENDRQNQYIIFMNSFKRRGVRLEWLKKYPNVEIKNFGFPNKFFNLFLWFFGWPKLDHLVGGADYFIMPNISFAAFSENCRFILVVHDLSFERFPSFFSLKRRIWHFIINPRSLCNQAEKIVAVSQSTKEDLMEIYKIEEKKIKTAFPNFSEEFLKKIKFNESDDAVETVSVTCSIEEIRKKYNLPHNFVLFLGTIEPRKNISSLVLAFEEMKRDKEISAKFPDLKLVIAGSKGWLSGGIFQLVQASQFFKDIVFCDFVEENHKPVIYKLAKIFIFPSFLEGFGYPPLEAMLAGTPVITSNTSSLPEVANGKAFLIDPHRPEEIFLAAKVLLTNDNVWSIYSSEGKKHALRIIAQKTTILDFI